MNTINKIGYKLVRNATKTADKAPYIGMAIPVGSLAYDNILSKMIKKGTFMTKATAKYLLEELYEYAAERIAEDVVRVNLGSVSIYPMISGSFDSEDAAFDPARNTLYVGASFSQAVRDAVAGIDPVAADAEASPTSVVLDSEMDIATQVFGVIDGHNDFRLAGRNLTVPDGEDESLALYDKALTTKVCNIVVSETDCGQLITCHLPDDAVVAKGTYRIRLASHGLDPTAPLAVVACTVKIVKAIAPVPTPPTLTKVHPSDEPENDGWMKPNPYENTVEGTNLATATKLEFKYVDGEDEYVDEFEIVSKTADKIVFKANASTLTDIGGHLIVTTPAGTCEGSFMATVMGS